MSSPAFTGALARSGVLAVALVTGLALVGSTGQSYLRADERAAVLAEAQVRAVLVQLAASLRPERGMPERRDLEAVLSQSAEQGLRYVALTEPTGRVLVAAGDALGAGRAPPEPGRHERIGERIRLVAPPPPPPGAFPPPARAAIPPSAPPPPALLLLEVEPALARSLVADARRSLMAASATAALLGLAAIVLFRLWSARERVARETLRQRHLATLGEMSAVLAHEIRNPLAVAKGHAQLLAERAQDDRQTRWVQRVVESLERLEELSADLLDLAKTGEVHPEDASVRDLIEGAAREADGDRVLLRMQASPERWTLDPRHMQTVLSNLLRNALQASPDSEPVELCAAAERGALVLRVRDRGPGISAGDLERIFEPFHTTRTRGAGLGLAIARRIVELHGGRITASNAADGGALFEVTLPGA